MLLGMGWGGKSIERAAVEGSFTITFEDGYSTMVYLHNPNRNILNPSYDLTHEITPEPEAPGRDWSGVVNELACSAISSFKLVVGNFFNGATFKKQALAILQEFDAQNPPIQSNCYGCNYELDLLIEGIINGFKEKNWYPVINNIKNNYPEQWKKYMEKSLATPENLHNFHLFPGSNPDVTPQQVADEIDRACNSPDFEVERPMEFVLGEMYQWKDSSGNEQIGMLVAKTGESLAMEYGSQELGKESSQYLSIYDPTLKHIAPKNHVFTEAEMIEELNLWESESISHERLCKRRKMMKQLLKTIQTRSLDVL